MVLEKTSKFTKRVFQKMKVRTVMETVYQV
jgi:hypothetical protein